VDGQLQARDAHDHVSPGSKLPVTCRLHRGLHLGEQRSICPRLLLQLNIAANAPLPLHEQSVGTTDGMSVGLAVVLSHVISGLVHDWMWVDIPALLATAMTEAGVPASARAHVAAFNGSAHELVFEVARS
jgi:hypothetical protein